MRISSQRVQLFPMFKPRLIYYISERRGEAFDLGGTREGRDRDAGDRPSCRREHRDPPSG